MQIVMGFNLKGCVLMAVLFTASRFMSAVMVLTQKPMKTSQYAKAEGESHSAMKDTIPAFVIMILVLLAAQLILSGGSGQTLLAELYSNLVFVVVILIAWIVARSDIKKLGGMSGDISGHMITLSEMFGMIALSLILW